MAHTDICTAATLQISPTGHWSLAIVCHPSGVDPKLPPLVLHLDSLKGGSHNTSNIVKAMAKYLQAEWEACISHKTGVAWQLHQNGSNNPNFMEM